MQEYSVVNAKPFITMSKKSFCEVITLTDGEEVDKFTRDLDIHISDYFIDSLEQAGMRGPIRHNKNTDEDEYSIRYYRTSSTYLDYAKDIINNYVTDRKRLDLCIKEKRLVGVANAEAFKKMRSDIRYFEKMLDSILSEYRDYFNERFIIKKSIRKYAAEHNLNRGSVNHIQKKFYTAFAEQLAIRDKAQNKCRLKKPTE